ncbi:MAG: RNA-binding transcriptional accessory protein [Erysipelotrichia bacterium]|nr:RNA-binding transcriptional accessory protein [Erysipelotrichia bacterium]NCC55047.1 RNA-binding transcriptional accessory protein [Erysipelotrichia bacterium]
MELEIIKKIALELQISEMQVKNTLGLLEEGSTVPFIARYRKEMTKGLDEEQIRVIAEGYEYQVNLEKRKEDVLRLIETQGKLSEEIVQQVNACSKLAQVEDIYRPYKQKKKTRASVAIASGLEPLANLLLRFPKTFCESDIDPFLNETITSREDAIDGAKDIIAEKISDNVDIRNKIYDSMIHYGKIKTVAKKNHSDEAKVYKMYYEYEERLSTLAAHRIMAIDRAEKEKVISVSIVINEEYLFNWVSKRMIKYPNSATSVYVSEAISDGLKRLAFPSIERMVRSELTQKAQESSIEVFSFNLERLLLQPPMKNKTILGFDPAFRTGCKLAIIDDSGKNIYIDVIYPHKPNAKVAEAETKLVKMCKDYHVDLIAIGNGTASRESESFVASTIAKYKLDVAYTIVSEAGASVYSASKLAIEEFPDLHVEQRSAISIARRLLDPLSELIKIDPQSIGVGQYQHDLPVARLKQRLDFVVEKAVNLVGVNINTASVALLKNVAGLSAAMANSIIAYREEKGKIESRAEIKKIAKIGTKSFEQAAGFLRIEDGKELLDRTSIHPESCALAKNILATLTLKVEDMGSDVAIKKVNACDKEALALQMECDMYTLEDILEAIKMPLRDYRDQNDGPILRKDILTFEDLKLHDELEGVVRNVVDFGAFVDIGLKEDGLVHISQLAKHRVKHSSDIVSVGDIVNVWVHKIDEEKHKVQLTMIEPEVK